MSETKKKLDANIPEDAVEVREQAGRQLSYLSGAYVIKRMNDVLGQGNWGYGIQELTPVFEGKAQQRSGEVFTVSYIAKIQMHVVIEGKDVYFTDVGYGDGTDKTNPGKAHELATKEAVTDGIKRCAKNLGISMGLGLYFKDGNYVGTEEEAKPNKQPAPVVKVPDTPRPAPKAATPAPTREIIKAAFGVLRDQKKITAQEFSEKYVGGKKVDAVPDEQLPKILESLNRDFPHLKLGA